MLMSVTPCSYVVTMQSYCINLGTKQSILIYQVFRVSRCCRFQTYAKLCAALLRDAVTNACAVLARKMQSRPQEYSYNKNNKHTMLEVRAHSTLLRSGAGCRWVQPAYSKCPSKRLLIPPFRAVHNHYGPESRSDW